MMKCFPQSIAKVAPFLLKRIGKGIGSVSKITPQKLLSANACMNAAELLLAGI